MVSTQTEAEIEEYLGQVPSWLELLSEAAGDHSWGIVRDLELEETELPAREKSLVALGAAAAMNCPYCVHFHREEAKLEDITETELAEATNLAATVRYFSTVLHGSETDLDEFKRETSEIVEYIEEQQATAAGD
ncbi:carboxymuconolactone decarboxylase family protein [Halogeometricum borinquense]|uniref:Carboxymuconolactone decarboxylase family protein n=1 Tax=Halogeometricum borinquense TaxID=60847 RepID=A0A6C0UDI4_9EURY|nr:carboxymuconolactone decarboxylase family protein [Halogeometricum borinquense]QIB73424.1 carboxymuconolactone decarboxylase family protein [Halogeometricum borinquense]QIQ77175.1 carboxymuconolactone decarboxylase family protein [Halogeometricum borinquense]